MWNEGSPLYKQICGLPEEEKRQLLEQLVKADPRTLQEAFLRALSQCTDGAKEKIREAIGCGCGTHNTAKLGEMLKDMQWCNNRRLSVLEENRLRANVGGTVDIPTVAGAGGVQTVQVPAYGVEYFIREFSMDGAVSVPTGSLSKVHVQIVHAGQFLAEFRASQYDKASCCTTIADQFKRMGVCFGYDSTWEVTVRNMNTNAAEEFVNGVLSFARGFPAPVTPLYK